MYKILYKAIVHFYKKITLNFTYIIIIFSLIYCSKINKKEMLGMLAKNIKLYLASNQSSKNKSLLNKKENKIIIKYKSKNFSEEIILSRIDLNKNLTSIFSQKLNLNKWSINSSHKKIIKGYPLNKIIEKQLNLFTLKKGIISKRFINKNNYYIKSDNRVMITYTDYENYIQETLILKNLNFDICVSDFLKIYGFKKDQFIQNYNDKIILKDLAYNNFIMFSSKKSLISKNPKYLNGFTFNVNGYN